MQAVKSDIHSKEQQLLLDASITHQMRPDDDLPVNFFVSLASRFFVMCDKDGAGPAEEHGEVPTANEVKPKTRRKKFVGRSKSSKSEGAVSKRT